VSGGQTALAAAAGGGSGGHFVGAVGATAGASGGQARGAMGVSGLGGGQTASGLSRSEWSFERSSAIFAARTSRRSFRDIVVFPFDPARLRWGSLIFERSLRRGHDVAPLWATLLVVSPVESIAVGAADRVDGARQAADKDESSPPDGRAGIEGRPDGSSSVCERIDACIGELGPAVADVGRLARSLSRKKRSGSAQWSRFGYEQQGPKIRPACGGDADERSHGHVDAATFELLPPLGTDPCAVRGILLGQPGASARSTNPRSYFGKDAPFGRLPHPSRLRRTNAPRHPIIMGHTLCERGRSSAQCAPRARRALQGDVRR